MSQQQYLVERTAHISIDISPPSYEDVEDKIFDDKVHEQYHIVRQWLDKAFAVICTCLICLYFLSLAKGNVLAAFNTFHYFFGIHTIFDIIYILLDVFANRFTSISIHRVVTMAFMFSLYKLLRIDQFDN